MGKAAAQPYFNEKRDRWEVFVELPPVAGKRRRKQVVGDTKTLCRHKADRIRAGLLTTGSADNDAITVAELMAAYLDDARHGLKPRSIEQYEGWSARYVVPLLGTRRVAGLRPSDIRRWHTDLRDAGYSTGSIRAGHRVLGQALRFAEREEVVGRNVARIQGGPRDIGDVKRINPLTPSEVADLLAASEGWRLEALVYVLVGCGLRISEALGLTWGAVNLDEGTLRVEAQVQELKGRGKVFVKMTKTASSQRAVAIPAVVVAKLRAHRVAMIEERRVLGAGPPGDDDVVFPNEWHQLGDRSNIARALKAVAEQAGVDGVHPHRLRHTYVSFALEAGVALEAVSESVGHARIGTTKDIYGQLQNRSRRRVADALDAALTEDH